MELQRDGLLYSGRHCDDPSTDTVRTGQALCCLFPPGIDKTKMLLRANETRAVINLIG